jgi:sugar phosphate isomerase/epimerase
MIPLGIFAKTFSNRTLEAALDEVAALELGFVQFNFSCVGLATLPEAIEPSLLERIHAATTRLGIEIVAISGTFNIIDPDRDRRDSHLRRLGVLAAACKALGTSIITLSSGTRDPSDMWRAHPDNSSPAAWDEMLESIGVALWITETSPVTLAVEPEPGNVMSDARKARKLLDEIGSPRLQVLFDAANILAGKPGLPQRDVLAEAFDLVGSDIVLAHGKELVPDDQASRIPGHGELDWDLYLELLTGSGYAAPLVLHGFDEAHAAEAVEFVRRKLRQADPVR